MGTWGTGPFDDDGSMDMALMLDHPRGGLEAVRKELRYALASPNFAATMAAFAAAEIVYAARSGDTKRVPKEVRDWLKKNAKRITQADLTKAAGVARILLDLDDQRGWRDESSKRSYARKVKNLQKRICTLIVKKRRANPVGDLLYALASAGR